VISINCPRFKPWAKFKPWAIRLMMNRTNRFNGLGISGLILFLKEIGAMEQIADVQLFDEL